MTKEPDTLSIDAVAANMRFYGDLRFKQLTVWLAGMTLLAAGAVRFPAEELASTLSVRQAVAVAAPVFTSTFWIMEVSSTLYWVAHREARGFAWHRWAVEAPENSKKSRTDLLSKIFTATNATFLLYASTYAAWIWLGGDWGLSIVTTGILVVLGLAVLSFTTRRYWPLWTHAERARTTQQIAPADPPSEGG